MILAEQAQTFTISQAAKLSGLSRPMVEYLCRERLVTPAYPGRRGRGHHHRYCFGDVVILRALTGLLKHGVEVRRLKGALRQLRRHHVEISVNGRLPISMLVTNGRRILLKRNGQSLEELVSGQMCFLFVVELESIRREIVRELPNMLKLCG
jgi:DNA-binding transcriptional MerR regulator